MLLTLTRRIKNEKAIIGDLVVDGKRRCFTLERADKAIPVGTYAIELTFSPRFHQLMPLLDIPGRSAIRIHPANYPDQLEGCIAPGTVHDLTSISNSNAAFEPLFADIKKAIDNWGSVVITVNEAY